MEKYCGLYNSKTKAFLKFLTYSCIKIDVSIPKSYRNIIPLSNWIERKNAAIMYNTPRQVNSALSYLNSYQALPCVSNVVWDCLVAFLGPLQEGFSFSSSVLHCPLAFKPCFFISRAQLSSLIHVDFWNHRLS